MKTSRSSEQQLLIVLGNALKTAVLGLAVAVVLAIAVAIGYQADKQGLP